MLIQLHEIFYDRTKPARPFLVNPSAIRTIMILDWRRWSTATSVDDVGLLPGSPRTGTVQPPVPHTFISYLGLTDEEAGTWVRESIPEIMELLK